MGSVYSRRMLDSPFMAVFGRLHPMVLHLPIGLLFALAMLEALAIARRRPLPTEVRVGLAWLAAGFAVVTAASGLMLSRESAYTHDGVWWHQWLGIGTAVAALACAISTHARAPRWLYWGTLALGIGLVTPAGHLGSGLTRGDGFLLAPLSPPEKKSAPPRGESPKPGPTREEPKPGAPAAQAIDPAVASIFAANCVGCHNATKLKGGLALDSADGLKFGGDDGAVVIPGNPGHSEIMVRLLLTPGDKEHMPPPGKKALSAAEVETIRKWIEAGASGIGSPDKP
jgi:mono/diheme cytochrome c family protein/uncharacterized membrane protein